MDLHYSDAAAVEDSGNFDLLGEDPLEWLIETDCSQHYLPESSLPIFSYSADDGKVADDTEEEEYKSSQQEPEPEPDMLEDALLHNMVDPNVTMQSLLLPFNDIMQH